MNHDATAGGATPPNDDLQAAVNAIDGIMEGTSDLIAVVDRNFRLLAFNQSYREVFFRHFKTTIQVGESLTEALSHLPDVQQHVVDCWQRALHGETYTVDQYKGDSQREWYETRYTPIRDKSGAVVGASHISRSMSDRIRTELELRESEEKFRVLFENATDAIYVQDLKGRFFDANQKATSQLGYSKDELLRMSPWDIDSPEDLVRVPERLERVKREGELTFEAVQIRKDGAAISVEINSKIVFYAGQKVMLSVVRDLTERNRAIQATLEREELYRGLFLNEHTAMMLVEPETGQIVEANPAAAEFYGYRREALRGMKVSDFNTSPVEDIRDNFEQALHFVQNRFEVTHRLAMGTLRHVEIFSGPVHIKGRNLLYSIIHDVTNRKQAEKALRESEERFRVFFRASPVPTAILHWEKSRIIDANDALLNLLEYTAEEALGRSTMELGVWEDENERSIIRNALAVSGTIRDLEGRVRTKAGELRTVLLSGDSIELDGEDYVLLVAKDISLRKSIEENLLRKNAILEGQSRIFWDSMTCDSEEELGMACLTVAEQLTDSEFSFLGELGADGKVHDIAISGHGWEACQVAGDSRETKRMPHDGSPVQGLYGRVLTSGTTLVANEPESHQDSVGIPSGHPRLDCFLGVPLKHGEKTIGLMGLGNKPGGYSSDDAEVVEALAVAIIEALFRKRAENKAADLAKFPEENPNPVLRITEYGTILYANQASARLLESWDVEIGGPLPAELLEESRKAKESKSIRQIESVISGRTYTFALTPVPTQGYVNLYGLDITERKHMEEALRASEERFRLATSSAKMGTYTRNLQTGEDHWSPEFLEIYGIAPGETLSCVDGVPLAVHPEDRPQVLAEAQNRLKEGVDSEFSTEHRIIRSDGETRWVMIRGRMETAPDGTPAGSYGVAMDITERKQIEQALRESRRDLNRAQAVAHVGSWRLNLRRDTLEWSEESHRIFGVAPGTKPLNYETFLECVHPEDRESVDAQWQATLQGEPYDMEHRIVRDGKVRWVRELASLEFDEHGGLIGAFGTTQDITERKQIEEALRASEERFRLVVENSRDGIHLLDLKTQRYTFISPAQSELTGFTLEELLELTADETFQRLHPEDQEWAETYLNQVVKGEDPGLPVEYRWKVKSGEYRWFSDSRKAILDEHSRAVALVGVSRDVTWRKEMEEQLIQAVRDASDARRESERRNVELQAALQSAPIGTVFYDQDHKITYLNESAELLLGFTMVDIRDMTAQQRVKLFELSRTDGSPFRLEDLVGYRALQGETVTGEEFLVRPRGGDEPIHVLSQAAPINLGSEIIGAVQIIADVTERKETEEALRESEKRYRALIDASSQVVYRMSPDWSKMHQLRGGDFLTNSEDPNRNWMQDYIHPQDWDHVQRAIEEAVQTGTVFELEHRIVRADGTIGWTYSRAVPVRDENGEVVEWFGAASDVTQRRRIEEQLREAKQEADRASQAKSEFLANMSHEIRTPLTGLLGMTDLLMDSLKKEKNIEYVRYMKRAGEALRIIIDDILDLSKIEAGRMEYKPVSVLIAESIRQGVTLFEPMAREKGLDWTISLAPGLPENVCVDEPKLHQVLRNLVSNAIKFTDRGGITVEVLYAEQAEPGELRIDVRDSGVGIPEDRHHELFQEFTQLDSSYQKMHGGTGLGLAISRQLVELMGGEITFESELNAGSTFVVIIPAPRAEIQEVARSEYPNIFGCEHLRILAAEDNPINQFLLREMLAESKCRFALVENGARVLEELEQATEPYDLVLMDINMPEMDGIQTTKLIRESGKPYADIPVIALTAYAMPEERERFLASGLDGYLAKPFTIRQLLLTLNELPRDRIRQGLADHRGQHSAVTFGKPAQAEAEQRYYQEQKVLDETYLTDHFGGNKEGLRSLIELVEEDTPGQLDRLRSLVQQKQYAAAADQAHYVAGGLRTVGLLHVASECLRLEQLLRDEHIDEAAETLDQLEHDIENAIDAVRQWASE